MSKGKQETMSEILEPKDYTPEIWACIFRLKDRMSDACIPFEDEDVIVLRHDSNVFILANPTLGEESIYDELGRFKETVPMRNITLIWADDWYKSEPAYDSAAIHFTVTAPRLRILVPELCIKLDSPSGTNEKSMTELQLLVEEEEATRLQASMSRMLTNVLQAVQERIT